MPRELTCQLREKRVAMCHKLLELLKMEKTFGFARVVTRDELWLHLNASHARMKSISDDEHPVHPDQTIASEKQMLSVLWCIRGP
jgi:hypothetical protein